MANANINLQSLSAHSAFGLGGVDRVFLISGIPQVPIAPGIIVFPTSEVVPVQTLSSIGYAYGSSQFYTIGQVYWNNALRVEGVDYTLVAPFTHIIQFDPSTVTTNITLVYSQWDIGVRAGFQVNSYPVPFSFLGTSIIADVVPPQGKFFIVQFTMTRPGTNPMSLFARFPNIINDILPDHTLYDEPNGFSTYRQTGYKIFDRSDHAVWSWTGISWFSLGTFPENTVFFVKLTGEVYQIIGGSPALIYTAGDGANLSIPEVLTYPPYGESIGKNLLVDAFSSNASTNYPSAYTISQRPGPCEDAAALNFIGITGIQAYSQTGILLDTVTIGPVGVVLGLQVTSALGVIGITSTRQQIALTGQQLNAVAGVLSARSNRINEIAIGQSVTSAIATFLFASNKSLSGVSSTSAIGTFGQSSVSGVISDSVTTSVGTFAVTSTGINKNLTGLQANSVIGPIIVNLNVSRPLTGLQATTAAGSVTKVTARLLIGDEAVTNVGTVVARIGANPVGVVATASIGNFASIKSNVVNLLGLQVVTAVPVAAVTPFGIGNYGAGIYSGTLFIG